MSYSIGKVFSRFYTIMDDTLTTTTDRTATALLNPAKASNSGTWTRRTQKGKHSTSFQAKALCTVLRRKAPAACLHRPCQCCEIFERFRLGIW